MNTLNRLHNSVFARFDRAEWLLPLLARLVFAGVLLTYFWAIHSSLFGRYNHSCINAFSKHCLSDRIFIVVSIKVGFKK